MKLEDEDNFGICPNCGEDTLVVIQEWVSLHDKEALLHCYKCDKIFIVYYKFDRMEELSGRLIYNGRKKGE